MAWEGSVWLGLSSLSQTSHGANTTSPQEAIFFAVRFVQHTHGNKRKENGKKVTKTSFPSFSAKGHPKPDGSISRAVAQDVRRLGSRGGPNTWGRLKGISHILLQGDSAEGIELAMRPQRNFWGHKWLPRRKYKSFRRHCWDRGGITRLFRALANYHAPWLTAIECFVLLIWHNFAKIIYAIMHCTEIFWGAHSKYKYRIRKNISNLRQWYFLILLPIWFVNKLFSFRRAYKFLQPYSKYE